MFRKTMCLIVLASLLFTSFSSFGLAEGADPLELVPNDSVFCLRINNFSQSLGDLDKYLAGASPLPLGMLVNMQLAGILGDPMLTGLDLSGDFCFFGVFSNPEAQEPIMGLLVPVTNYNDFVSKNENCTKFNDSTMILAAPDSSVGAMLLTATSSPNYALVVPESEQNSLPILKKALDSKTANMTQRLKGTQTPVATTAPVWAYVNIADLYTKFSPMLTGLMQMAQMQSSEQAPAGVGEILQFEMKMLDAMLKEFAGDADSITLALTPKADLLTLDLDLQAKTGSGLADIFKGAAAAKSYTLTNYLDNNNAVNALMNFEGPFMLKMYDKFFDVFGAAIDDPEMKAETEKMRALTKKAFAAMGDEISVSYNYGAGMPPFMMQEVVEVKDMAAMQELTKEGLVYANSLYKTMGLPIELKYESNTGTYKNAVMDTVTLSVTESDNPDEMQQSLAAVYGPEGFQYYVAHTADKYYITMGADGQQKLKDLIDKPAAGAPSGDIKIALDALSGTPYTDTVASINIIKLMQGMAGMMESMSPMFGGEETAGPVSPAAIFGMFKNVPTQSCMVLGGKVANGQAGIRLGLPKQHLTELMAVAMQMQMQMQMMQEQMQQQQQSPEMGTEAPTMVPMESGADSLQSWIGKPAPELKMTDMEGNIYRVSRLKGKTVMLDFWATWCPPCKKAIPDLIKLRDSTPATELVILGLSDEPDDILKPFVTENKMNYPVISTGTGLPAPYNQIAAIPTLFIIDSNGIIQDISVGYHPPEEIQAKLDALK